MLINLGCFWEILDYCAASAKPRAAQKLIAPELYAPRDGPKDEVSLTSLLPDTLRLGDYNDREQVHTSAILNHQSGDAAIPGLETKNQMQNSIVYAEATGIGADWSMGLNNFSDNELAVLVNDFFDVANPNVDMDDGQGGGPLGICDCKGVRMRGT